MKEDNVAFLRSGNLGHLTNEDLGDWYEGQITDPMVCAVIQDHLDRCEQCSSRLAFLKRVLEEPAPVIDNRLNRELDRIASATIENLLGNSSKRRSRPWWEPLREKVLGPRRNRWAPVGVVAVFAALIASFYIRQPTEISRPVLRGDSGEQLGKYPQEALDARPRSPFSPPEGLVSSTTQSEGPAALRPVNTSVLPGRVTFQAETTSQAQSYQLVTYRVSGASDLLPYRKFPPRKAPEYTFQAIDKVFTPGQWYTWRMVAKLPTGKVAEGSAAAFRVLKAAEVKSLTPSLPAKQRSNRRIMVLARIKALLNTGLITEARAAVDDYPQETDADRELRRDLLNHIDEVNDELTNKSAP